TLQPYLIFIPSDYTGERRYPLMVFLHGSGTDERSLSHKNVRRFIPPGFIALAPRGRGTSNCFSTQYAQHDIMESMQAVIHDYSIDTNRVLLAGFSMGGYGVYRTYYEQGKHFRAAAVFSGHPDLANRWSGKNNHPDFRQSAYLKPFQSLPMFIFHGQKDRNTPFELTQTLIDQLIKTGARVTWIIEEETGHSLPEEANWQRYYRWVKDHF
ncbi:MAG: prolyl oligopeptidase family serine peptidase, partial [Caldithrix sp.]|nr:prolyl oligopeptidase family serine peptidase [Caldithrix sp.]